jgi:hypothetical protein
VNVPELPVNVVWIPGAGSRSIVAPERILPVPTARSLVRIFGSFTGVA